jgi:formate-dependent nitrite reductase cytochrome c552 subunit
MLVPWLPVMAQDLSGSRGTGLASPSSAEICGDCHRAAQESWKASGHAHAMDSRLFQDVLHYTGADLGAEARRTCLGCHSPLAIATGDTGMQTKVGWEGVTCDVCHSIREVSLAGPNPKARLEFTRMRTGPWKDDTPSQHGALFSPLHTTSLLCAPCHEYRNALGFAVVTTFSEWQASRDGKDGRQCQFCHMPSVGRVALVQRVVTTPTDVERHSHCQTCHLASGAGGKASQAGPGPAIVDAGLRVHGQLNLHEIKGSDSMDLLTSAIQAQLAAVRDGDKVRVNVDVANRAAAHYVPTGSPLRRVILEVRADTDSGQHLMQQRVYSRSVADRDGKPLEREYMVFERGAKVIADTRLAPDEKRSETFSFDVPPGVETRISVALRYFYSPLAKTESQRSATFLTLNAVVR